LTETTYWAKSERRSLHGEHYRSGALLLHGHRTRKRRSPQRKVSDALYVGKTTAIKPAKKVTGGPQSQLPEEGFPCWFLAEEKRTASHYGEERGKGGGEVVERRRGSATGKTTKKNHLRREAERKGRAQVQREKSVSLELGERGAYSTRRLKRELSQERGG